MKNLKVKLSVLALILGMGSAFATMKHQSLDRKWGIESDGSYTEVTGQEAGIGYDCLDSDNVCTETYSPSVDPNNNPTHVAPTGSEPGDFR